MKEGPVSYRRIHDDSCMRGDLLEAVWCEEVEQVKQLLQVVLERRSSQQQLVVDLVVVQTPEKLKRRENSRSNKLEPFHTCLTLLFVLLIGCEGTTTSDGFIVL